eukprot:m.123455 g.123455  ORF g.123455 m.123455 type:complete len:485 (+) comp37822_c2_seq23:1034-2488(+)
MTTLRRLVFCHKAAFRAFANYQIGGTRPFFASPLVWGNSAWNCVFYHRRSLTEGIPGVRLNMPALSPTMDDGKIVKWLVKEGESFVAGDPLCEIETDKAVMTMDALDDGTMAKILVPEGTSNIKINALIGLAVAEGEDHTRVEVPEIEVTTTSNSSGPSSEPVKTVQTMAAGMFQPTSLPLSPAVKRLVEELRLDMADIPTSGKKGRLLKGDVLQFVGSQEQSERSDQSPAIPLTEIKHSLPPPSPPPPTLPLPPKSMKGFSYEDISNTGIRSIIAKRLVQAKTTIPHAYASTDCALDNILEIRKQLKAEGFAVSVNDFIVKAAATALRLVPAVNVNWSPDGPQRLSHVDVSVAVASDRGLITPIVKSADQMGVKAISASVKELASKARDGKLQPHEFQGGSFTISNLGMYGITHFSAVINPPQACILAVGGSRAEPNEEGEGITNWVTVTMSSDARIVDETLASQWLQAFKRCVEKPLQNGLM